jgi:rubrerythrin
MLKREHGIGKNLHVISPIRNNPIDSSGVAAWLEAAYHDEKKGIIEYEKLYKRIEGVPEYAPLRKTLKRIIKDEKRHFNTLSRILGF